MAATHWRFAVGTCMLSAALLVSSAGAAIAAADPDSSESTVDSGDVDGSSQIDVSVTEPVAIVADTDTPDSLTDSSQEESAGPTGPMAMAITTDAGDGAASVTVVDNQGSNSTPAAVSGDTSHMNPVVSHPEVPEPPTDAVSSDAVSSDAKVVAPTITPLVVVQTAVEPVTDAVATVAQAVGSISAVFVSLPSSATPVTDVITAVQDMLTSVTAAGVPLAQLPSDLASLLGFPGLAPGGIGRSLAAGGSSATIDAQVLPARAAEWQQIPLASDGWSVPSPGKVAGHPALGGVATTGLSQSFSVSGLAPAVPDDVASTGVLSFLGHHISAVLVPASLLALAAMALPGIGGLLIISAAGTLVGYRQAKAASTLRTAGIARFARLGPLGVVRSGSQVVLRPRALTVVRRQPLQVASHLESVA